MVESGKGFQVRITMSGIDGLLNKSIADQRWEDVKRGSLRSSLNHITIKRHGRITK